MIEVIRQDELVKALEESIETLRNSRSISLTADQREWMEEGYLDVLDRVSGWCSKHQRIPTYKVEEADLDG